MRLYKAHYLPVDDAEDDYLTWDGLEFPDETPGPLTEAEGAPAGWDEHCLSVWGKPHEFFLPSDRPIYRSRSAAQSRVDLINRWAGEGAAILLETETNWLPIADANARRRQARNATKIARLRAEIARLEADA